MLEVTTVEMNPDSREEYLPGYTPQFPHIASHVVAARYESSTTPWHWHESVELFYLRRGAILYRTPHEERVIRTGQGGMVNSNVLHSTRLLAYLNTHYAEHITTPMLAAAAYCSERECYRIFQNCLHTTPTEYLRNIRLQSACRLLLETDTPVTEIAQLCGLGSSSYFGRLLRQETGLSPSDYRRKWQNRTT